MQGQPDLSISEIAGTLKLSPSTIHRIVRALVAHGFLNQDTHTDRYYLGRSAVLLGQMAQHIFAFERIVPLLDHLAQETGESVNLGVREGKFAMVMFRVESLQPLRFNEPPGTLVPLHCSAMGKALLASSEDPAAEVSALTTLSRQTPNTIVRKDDLLAELKQTRRRGFSLDNEESFPGARCVGAAVPRPGEDARMAVAVQAPTVRLSVRDAKQLGPRVMDLAKRIAEIIPADRTI